MIGHRATWRHRNPDGTPVVPLDGTIATYAHSPTRGFVALILQQDGTYREEQVANLIATDPSSGPGPSGEGLNARNPMTSPQRSAGGIREEIEQAFAVVRGRLEEIVLLEDEPTVPATIRVLGELRDRVVEQQHELEQEAAVRQRLRERLTEIGLPIEADESPGDATARLLSELRDELVGIAGERDTALREVDRLGKELEVATAKKPGRRRAAPVAGDPPTE